MFGLSLLHLVQDYLFDLAGQEPNAHIHPRPKTKAADRSVVPNGKGTGHFLSSRVRVASLRGSRRYVWSSVANLSSTISLDDASAPSA